MFSVVKVSERATALVVSPAKQKSNQVTSFLREFLPSLTRVLWRAGVVASCQSLSKQTLNLGKIPIRDSKECKQQAIEFDFKKIQVTSHVA